MKCGSCGRLVLVGRLRTRIVEYGRRQTILKENEFFGLDNSPKPGSRLPRTCTPRRNTLSPYRQASSIVLSAQRWPTTRRTHQVGNVRFHPVKGLKWRTIAQCLRWRPIIYGRRGVESFCPHGIGETGVVRTALVCTPIVRSATPFLMPSCSQITFISPYTAGTRCLS